MPQINVGRLANNLSNDLSRLFSALLTGMQLIDSPIVLAVYGVILMITMGVYSLGGVSILALILCLVVLIGYCQSKLMFRKLGLNDARNKEIALSLSRIKGIKLGRWEPAVQLRIIEIRRQELRILRKIHFWTSCQDIIIFAMPSLAAFVSVALHNRYQEALGLADVFFIYTIFNMLSAPLRFFALGVKSFCDCNESFRRLNLFLELPEEEIFKNRNEDMAAGHLIFKDAMIFYENQGPVKRRRNKAKIKQNSKVLRVPSQNSAKYNI